MHKMSRCAAFADVDNSEIFGAQTGFLSILFLLQHENSIAKRGRAVCWWVVSGGALRQWRVEATNGDQPKLLNQRLNSKTRGYYRQKEIQMARNQFYF